MSYHNGHAIRHKSILALKTYEKKEKFQIKTVNLFILRKCDRFLCVKKKCVVKFYRQQNSMKSCTDILIKQTSRKNISYDWKFNHSKMKEREKKQTWNIKFILDFSLSLSPVISLRLYSFYLCVLFWSGQKCV